MPNQIVLDDIRVTYSYDTNSLTATCGEKCKTKKALSIDIAAEAAVLAAVVSGRNTLSLLASTDDVFVFRSY